MSMYNGYCVKCKEKRDFDGSEVETKTGMLMAKGPCPTCGTTVNRILGKAGVKPPIRPDGPGRASGEDRA